ncbi:MAG: hypothetical protein QOH24_1792 [Verrucomicrobiota bacterium]
MLSGSAAKARLAPLDNAFSARAGGKNPALLLQGLAAQVESRVLILNHDPVFEDRLLSFFDTEEGTDIRVVRSVSETVLVLIAENFDGFIVEGSASLSIEAATVARQHFPSLKILCVPWQRLKSDLLDEAERQHIATADGAASNKRLRQEVMQFVRSLKNDRNVPEEGIDPCHSLIGNLNQFSAAEILQMACLSQRSGRFTFKSSRGKSEIYLHHGSVRHAIYGTLEGEAAVAEIFRWRQGRFYFEEGLISHAHTVDRPWAHLLIDNLQKLDETLDVATVTPKQ